MKTNHKMLFIIFSILLVLVGVILYFIIFQDKKKIVEDKELSPRELFELYLTYSKPNNGVFIEGDFVYCEGEEKENYEGCSPDFKRYYSYRVGSDEYQLVHIDLIEAKIKNEQLKVSFYIYNYEQSGKLFCNNKITDLEMETSDDEIAKNASEICTPFTYTFDIKKDNKTDKLIYTEA